MKTLPSVPVLYEIYVRSFQDSDGDGVGDLQGVIAKLEYLRALGVNAVWLTPIFASPNRDFGYDVSDYDTIHPDYGTMSDLHELVRKAHALGIKVLLDLVLNHCSDRHPWFVAALQDKASPFRDFFIFRDRVENNLGCQFGTSAWHPAGDGTYYLGLFSQYQPDFNWRNPELRKRLLAIVEKYLDIGVDGYRFDVLSLISKPKTFHPLPALHDHADFKSYANHPGIGRHLGRIRRILSRYGALSIGEGSGLTKREGVRYGRYLSLVLTFDLVGLDGSERDKWTEEPYDLPRFAATLAELQRLHRHHTPHVLFIENHDQPRIVSRIASGGDRARAAKAIATVLYGLDGVPLLYQGQELGLANYPFEADELTDIESRNAYARAADKEKILAIIRAKARDHGRVAMPWDATPQAGFTTGVPWTVLPPEHATVNAAVEGSDPDSVLNYYRKLLSIRGTIRGRTRFLKLAFPLVGYRRGDHLVLANLSGARVACGVDVAGYEIILTNGMNAASSLPPWQATIYRIQKRSARR